MAVDGGLVLIVYLLAVILAKYQNKYQHGQVTKHEKIYKSDKKIIDYNTKQFVRTT